MAEAVQFHGKLLGVAALVALGLLDGSDAAYACDDFASRLIDKAIRPSIESLDCGSLGKIGMDVGDHHLISVCYTSTGPTSTIEMVTDLKCKTSDQALIKTQIADRVTARAEVKAADCQLLDVSVTAAGEIGKLLLDAFDVSGKARDALVHALSRLC